MLYLIGHQEEAEKCFKEDSQLDSSYVEALNKLAVLNFNANKHKEWETDPRWIWIGLKDSVANSRILLFMLTVQAFIHTYTYI